MTTTLTMAPRLSLPVDATTQAIAIVAKRRVGKSYTARRFAEQLLKAGQQVVIADPKGDWWGIRSSADGKAPGFPVVILGGEHGDVPLEKGAGEVIAKLVVEERVSVLLDLSFFRKSEVAVFMADFLEALYRLKAKEALRTPLMLIVDEADAIFPQKPNPGEERMLGAGEDIVRRGGQRGIGCMMITQRTAVLNKNVLTQCEMLIAMRTISPQDLKAMQAWVDVHGSVEERDTLMASLPSLPQGDAWFWSPGWPTAAGIFQRTHVSPIETFDSGATPKSGERRFEPKNPADVDLAALQRQMAATIEKAKADDPKELRKEIAALKKQLATPVSAALLPSDRLVEAAVARARQRIMKEAHAERNAFIDGIERHVRTMAKFAETLEAHGPWLREMLDRFKKGLPNQFENYGRGEAPSETLAPRAVRPDPEAPRAADTPASRPAASDVAGISAGAQRLLDAAAKFAALNIHQPTRTQVAALAPMSPTSSATERHFAQCIKGGYFDTPATGTVQLTESGRSAAKLVDAPPTFEEYVAEWQRLLGDGAERKLYDAMIAWGSASFEAISRSSLANRAGISDTSSATERGFAWLIGLELLVKAGTGLVKAGRTMFPEGF